MRFPLSLSLSLAWYIARKKIKGEGKFPLVLMLEPLHACNLSCTGCGRIREYKDTIKEMMTMEECLHAVEESGAPIVSICGGEPLIYPEIGELVRKIIEKKRHVYLCTNGVFLKKKLKEFPPPSSYFFFNVHLDGLEETHDLCVERNGVFQQALEGIKAAKEAGFMVCSNTTIYKETKMEEIEELFDSLRPLKLDGHILSPSYSYSAVQTKEIFMTREDIHEKFKDIWRLFKKFNLTSSPIYLEFLQGKRDLPCTAWGNPTRNPKGWKAPCYLITDGHYKSFREFMEETNWDQYGYGKDPRCEHCMVHCGYEPSAALGISKRPGDGMKMILWQFA